MKILYMHVVAYGNHETISLIPNISDSLCERPCEDHKVIISHGDDYFHVEARNYTI